MICKPRNGGYWYDMRFNKLSITATLALALTWQVASSDAPSATDRCMNLMRSGEVVEEAITVCAEAAKESREGQVRYGDILSAQKNAEGAIEYYSKAIDGVLPMKYPDTPLFALRRRALEYYHDDNEPLAHNDALAYLDHEPEDGDILFIAAATASSAESGLPFIERAIAVQPEDILNYGLYTRLLVRVGKHKEALAAADEAIRMFPKDPRGLTIKGLTYASMGEHAKAERLHARVVRAVPDDPQPKVNRADSLIALGRYEEAIAATTAALQNRPNYFEALQTRSTAHLAMGDGAAALADIKQANAVQPRWNAGTKKSRAEKIILAHQTLSPAGIARIEQDRGVILRGITRHLHAQCGSFRVPQFSADMDSDAVNSDVRRYSNCLKQWISMPEIEIHDSLTPAELAAGERLYDAKNIVYDADALRCSKMPERSKCIQDAVFTKVRPLIEGAEDPFSLVRKIEVDRLQNDVAALGKAIDRHNRGVAITDFLHGVAEALNE